MLLRPSDPMRRPFFTTAALMTAALAMLAGTAHRALAADGRPEPPVTPFIDSGNDLPDLEARDREARKARALEAKMQPRGKWYGWQLLTADLATAGCLAGLQSGFCVLSYWGSGIAIHLAHKRPAMAGTSFGLRTGIPALGIVVGLLIASCPERQGPPVLVPDLCGVGEAGIGMAVGAVIATAIDAALAFERPALAPPSEPTARRPLLIEPRLAVTRGGFSLGLGAAF
jgi:hypothetical protein